MSDINEYLIMRVVNSLNDLRVDELTEDQKGELEDAISNYLLRNALDYFEDAPSLHGDDFKDHPAIDLQILSEHLRTQTESFYRGRFSRDKFDGLILCRSTHRRLA